MSVRAVDTIGTDIWACTENGVMILDPGTGRDSIALDSVNAWDIGHLPNGSIWVGTPGGLWVYHQGNWTNLETTNSNLRPASGSSTGMCSIMIRERGR